MKALRIAVCDDEQAECELLEKYIREWASLREIGRASCRERV